jgi:hypothetical protein
VYIILKRKPLRNEASGKEGASRIPLIWMLGASVLRTGDGLNLLRVVFTGFHISIVESLVLKINI